MVWFHPVRRIRNTKRRIFRKKFDYIWLSIDFVPKTFPDPPIPLLQRLLSLQKPPPFDLWTLQKILNQTGEKLPHIGLIIEIRLNSLEHPTARLESIIKIIRNYRDNYHKEVIAFSHYYSLINYWFASQIASKGKLFILKTGVLDTRGIKYEVMFLGDTLKKYGFKFEKVAVSGYKSAYDNFTRTDIAPEAKKNLEWILETQFSTMVNDISTTRAIPVEKIESFINQAPWTDENGLKEGWVDKITTAEGLIESLVTDEKRKVRVVKYSKLKKILPIPGGLSKSKMVAIIPATGAIIDGKSRSAPPLPIPIPIPIVGDEQIGDQTLNSQIRKVLKDPTIKSVVLYINSPGGSVTASESIRSTLEQLAKKKPLIIYMDNVAASGGYYIATPGKKIIASPNTITGSIGVLSGKISAEKALEEIKSNTVIIKKGDHADWDTLNHPYSPEEITKQQEVVDHDYKHFIHLVSESREISEENLKNEIAGGRVWPGELALEKKIIDGLGSLDDAIAIARQEGNQTERDEVVIIHPEDELTPPLHIKTIDEYISELKENFQSLSKIHYWMINEYFFMNYK